MVGAEAHPGFYITQGYKWGLSTSPTTWKMPPFRFFQRLIRVGQEQLMVAWMMMISSIVSFLDGAVDIETEWS